MGLTWRAGPDEPFTNNSDLLSIGDTKPAGTVDDLDAIPLPAWDLIDFDRYAKVRNFMSLLKGKRYATDLYVARLPLLVYVLPRHLWQEIPLPLA